MPPPPSKSAPLSQSPSRSLFRGRSWKRRKAWRKAEEEFIAGDMCDATGEMHARTYVRTCRVCPCVYAHVYAHRFQRGATSGNVAHVHRRTCAHVQNHTYAVCRRLGRADDGPESPTFRGHGGRAQRAACAATTLADRAAPITGRAIYRRREIRAQGRAFSARAHARATARP